MSYGSPELQELLDKLATIARKGPLASVGQGDSAVGMTLLHALDVPHTSSRKAAFKGIAISARRTVRGSASNRVNLFARVPNWGLSACKSSAEILERFGYSASLGRQLLCSVESRRANAQGLRLSVERAKGLLQEFHEGARNTPVATWALSDLEDRLAATHPESLWVTAAPVQLNGSQYFHYRHAFHSTAPRSGLLGDLLDAGTVTIDHLISDRNGRVVEKGPLFKIRPANMDALFSGGESYDLLGI